MPCTKIDYVIYWLCMMLVILQLLYPVMLKNVIQHEKTGLMYTKC